MARYVMQPGPGLPALAMAALALAAATPADAAANIYHLTDLSFGTIGNLVADSTQAESVCVATGVLGGSYSVTATGTGGPFTLSGPGSATLAYEVQWSATSGQTSGQQLTAGSALTGQGGSLLDCTLGLVNDASLVVVLRAAALSGATAGSYSGTLTLLVAPN